MIVGQYFSMPVIACVGTIYPAYATYKAAVSAEPAKMALWLHYWMIFAVITTVQAAVDYVGAFVPFYYEAKIFFFLWLWVDKFQGATLLFKKYLEPQLAKHAPAIDEQLDFLVERLSNLKAEDMRTLVEWAQTKGAVAAAAAGVAKGAAVDKLAKAAAEQNEQPEEAEVIDKEKVVEDKKDQ